MWDEFIRASRVAELSHPGDEALQRRYVWSVYDRLRPSPTQKDLYELVVATWEANKHRSCGKDSCRSKFESFPLRICCKSEEGFCDLCGDKIHTYPARIVKDTGWQLAHTSNPQRGIHNYVRRIEFASSSTREELKAMFKYMRAEDCPGWIGLGIFEISPVEFQFTTTYDSSD
jgi:hypothetical protein